MLFQLKLNCRAIAKNC